MKNISCDTKKILIAISLLVFALIIVNYVKKNGEGFENNNDNVDVDDFLLDTQEDNIDQYLIDKINIPIGTIAAWMKPEIPKGWANCDGKIYNKVQTPDLTGKMILGSIGDSAPPITDSDRNKYRVETGNVNLTETEMHDIHNERYKYTLNQQGGVTEHTLTVEEMPRHNHNGEVLGGGAGPGRWEGTHYRPYGPVPAGGNIPHNNMPPFITLYWIMFVGY
jgi:microcystin-dependent protein